jgi:penicillin-binding protein 1A
MSGSLSFFSAVVGGFGLLLSSPLGPAQLPPTDFDELRSRAAPAYVARIRDAGGRELGEIFRDGPLASPLSLFPESFPLAVIAIEDRRFFEHDGIDPIGLAGAIASQFGSNPRGGSTIDQQMAKNAWTGPEESIRRKISEAVLALRARHFLGAEGVLQAYLETAWFGRGVTGAAGAAQAWFGRDWDELSLGEIAYLAGILKGPGFYDAARHPARAAQRRDQVLAAMLREGFIDEAAAEAARSEPITPAPRPMSGIGTENRWFLTAARSEITRTIDESPAWQSLFATIDVETTFTANWQSIAQSALSSGVRSISAMEPLAVLGEDDLAALRDARENEPGRLRLLARAHLSGVLPWDSDAQAAILLEREDEDWTLLLSSGEQRIASLRTPDNFTPRPGHVLALRADEDGFAASGRTTIEGAVVVLDPRDGSLLASVGGVDPALSAFDRTRARRQPGSAIKTFLWLAALDAGFHPSSPVPNYEQDFITEYGEIWRPRNYGRTQSGMIPFSAAYEHSSNLAAAALINAIGSNAMARMAEGAGAYPNGMPRHLSAALGTNEVTLLDLTRAHAAVVNDGVPRQTTALRDMRVDGQPLVSDGLRVGQGASVLARSPAASCLTTCLP